MANGCRLLLVTVLLSLGALLAESFYNQLSPWDAAEENVLVSPFLLAEGLALLYLGADGVTAKELRRVVPEINDNKDNLALYIMQNRSLLKSSDEVELKFGNRLYVAQDVDIYPEYKSEIKILFNAKVKSVDFQSCKTVNDINRWVARQTENKISKTIDRLEGDEQMVLLGAIYFHGAWKYPFDKANTRKASFSVPKEGSATRTVQVDMMSRINYYKYQYISEFNVDLVALPYTESNLTMVILLPRTIDNLDSLHDFLGKYSLPDLVAESQEKRMELHLPKFKFELSVKLNDYLQDIGIKQLFQQASFKGMTSYKQPLQVSNVIQTLAIEVDECGTEAREAGGIEIQARMADPHLDINHPFEFYIIDDKMIYFAGQVRDPTQTRSISKSY